MIRLVRYGLPALIALAGVGFIVLGAGAVGVAFGIVLIGIATLVLLVDVFARVTIDSQDDREEEERARRTYSRTGRWPPGGHSHRTR